MSIAPPPPRISVVIPTYQRREQVVRAVESVFAQRCPASEVLVVDDGSTDGTAELLRRRYGERVRVLVQPNRGASAARNRGIAAATGDAVAFLDSDNRWFDRHLAVVTELLERFPEAVLVGTQRAFTFGDEQPADARLTDLAEHLLLRGPAVGLTTSVAVRRRALLDAGAFDEELRYGEDTELFVRLSVLGPMALVSGRTFERGHEPNSLLAEGRRTGGYVGLLERCGDGALAVLDRTPRPDADRVREAALTARALGRAVVALDGAQPTSVLAAELQDAVRHHPALAAEPRLFLVRAAPALPRWHDPAWRLGALNRLIGVWPSRRGRALLRLRAVKAALKAKGRSLTGVG